MSTLTVRLGIAAAVAVTALAIWFSAGFSSPPSAAAHPLGNFTVNRYARLDLYADAVLVRYVVDMAEIPAFQERAEIDVDGDGKISTVESQRYIGKAAGSLRDGLSLTTAGEPADLELVSQQVSFPPGQAGLDTMRIALWLRADVAGNAVSISFRDSNYDGRLGWREIVVAPAPGVTLHESTAPTSDLSAELTAYPDDLLSSPPDVRYVEARYTSVGGISAPDLAGPETVSAQAGVEPRESGPSSAFLSLVNVEDATLAVVVLSLFAALVFGAIHALEPGHGKTLVAAYFVGIKGTARQAIALGLIIAATHTVGVLLIGLITIFGSQYVLPEDLYPWLSLAAGVMVLALGVRLVIARAGGMRVFHRIAHRFGHSHSHSHVHAPPPVGDGSPPWRGLIALGLADGLVPSPSTLVVLLAAVSLDRVGLGIALVVAFSVGLALVLTLISLALVYARRFSDWIAVRGPRSRGRILARIAAIAGNDGIASRYLPIAGALALLVVGAALTVRALPATGLSILF